MAILRLRSALIGTVASTVILAGCSASPDPSDPTATPTPSPSADASVAASDLPDAPETSSPAPTITWVETGYGVKIPAGGPGDCTGSAYIYISSSAEKTTAELLLPENLVDMGPREFAQGEVGYDDEQRVATYTVAAGDVAGVIGDRFCIYNGIALPHLNGYRGFEPIHPGDVLVLYPQAVPDFKYENPYN